MPERFEIYIVYKRRYKKYSSFPFLYKNEQILGAVWPTQKHWESQLWCTQQKGSLNRQ